ncbi:MAG: hypothetical protein RBG13Loki_0346 [Promethearchaeota archaeon CR_4]|nr:MAG: hypothetical protein RBG13Loki_0346 [Candidatus Lokiarchaeota archaeon CR_4]
MAEAFPYQNQILNTPAFIFSIMLLQGTVSVILLVLAVLVFMKYRENHKPQTKDLSLTFLFMGLSFTSATIPIILAHVTPYVDLIWGFPIFYANMHFWWTSISYALMTISVLFLLRFVRILFESPRFLFWVFSVLVIIFNIWNVYQGLIAYSLDPTVNTLPTIPWGILFVIIGFLPWVFVVWFAGKLFKRLEPSVFRVGVKYIRFSAICTVCSYLLFIARPIISEILLTGISKMFSEVFEFSYWIFFIFTGLLLYVGYTLPAWFRIRVDRHLQTRPTS